MTRLTVTIPGEPVAKGRPRASARVVETSDGPRAIVTVHTPKKTADAEEAVRVAFRQRYPAHRPLTRAVLVRFVAVFPIPSSWPRKLRDAALRGTLYHTSRPDKDNVEKLLVDALNGLAWADDAQVQGGGVKRYGHPARVELTIDAIDQPDVPATPGQRRTEERQADAPPHAPAHERRKPTKAGKRPERLQAAIDAALARDAAPAQPGLFGDGAGR